MKEAKVLISIVTYNSVDVFIALDTLKKTLTKYENYRILIFDNNSSENYKKKLNKYSDFAEINFHDSNRGFGFGHNYNAKDASEPYLLILNPDVLVTEQAIDEMIQVFEEDDEVGLVVPKVLNNDGSPQYLIRNNVSVFDYTLRFLPFKWLKRMFDQRLSVFECRDLSDNQLTPVRIGSGCFMLFKTNVFNKAEGFDERYFMYFEDYDLCLTLGELGYKIIYNPFATITHFYAKGAHKSFKLFRIFITSMIKFFNKWGWKLF